jgi:hypothetical protein
VERREKREKRKEWNEGKRRRGRMRNLKREQEERRRGKILIKDLFLVTSNSSLAEVSSAQNHRIICNATSFDKSSSGTIKKSMSLERKSAADHRFLDDVRTRTMNECKTQISR